MKCITLKFGKECAFMGRQKCTFPGSCHPIDIKCEGCKNIEIYNDITYCISYPYPYAKWNSGGCGLATHIVKVKEDIKKLNPLKASKKAAKKRKASK